MLTDSFPMFLMYCLCCVLQAAKAMNKGACAIIFDISDVKSEKIEKQVRLLLVTCSYNL